MSSVGIERTVNQHILLAQLRDRHFLDLERLEALGARHEPGAHCSTTHVEHLFKVIWKLLFVRRPTSYSRNEVLNNMLDSGAIDLQEETLPDPQFSLASIIVPDAC